MKTPKVSLILVFLCLILGSCRSNKDVSPTVSVTAMETVSLGSNTDGTIAVRAWGTGRNRSTAIDQAKRNAVHDVIFSGIKKGSNPGAASRPLVSEVNAEERHSDYFERFFSSGDYRRYVKEEPGTAPRMKSEGLSREGYGVVLLVDRKALRNKLINDGIIPNQK